MTMLEAFKNEIVEAENDRNDLLKWKLILVAVLSAVSLGIGAFSPQNPQPVSYTHLAVCLIPLVCAYVDLLCKHLQMRILVISKFFQDHETGNTDIFGLEVLTFKKYEIFCTSKRTLFSFEEWAQTGSTYVLCIMVICSTFLCKKNPNDVYIIMASGVLGLILTGLIDYSFKQKIKRLNSNS